MYIIFLFYVVNCSLSIAPFLNRYWKISGTVLVIELLVELRNYFKCFGLIDLKCFIIDFLMSVFSRHCLRS